MSAANSTGSAQHWLVFVEWQFGKQSMHVAFGRSYEPAHKLRWLTLAVGDLMDRAPIKGKDLRFRVRQQNGGMCCDQELDVVVVGYQFIEQDEKAKLTLGR